MEHLESSIDNGVCTIVLNRPESRNAFTLPMVRDWEALLRSCMADDDVRVVVVTGAGDHAFCSGIDMSWLTEENSPLQRKYDLQHSIQRVALAVDELDKPIIAAVNGVAVGAGLDMALMCDLRLMSATARVSEGYVKLGLAPGNGGSYYLPRLVGVSKALELLLTGDFVDADEALRIGLVNRVVPPERLEAETAKLAQAIASNPPASVRMIKRATRQSASIDLRTALDLASSHVAVLTTTDDEAEALTAVMEKRTATFTGR